MPTLAAAAVAPRRKIFRHTARRRLHARFSDDRSSRPARCVGRGRRPSSAATYARAMRPWARGPCRRGVRGPAGGRSASRGMDPPSRPDTFPGYPETSRSRIVRAGAWCRSVLELVNARARRSGRRPTMLECQKGKCAICGWAPDTSEVEFPLHVDHDHNCCPGDRSCGICTRQLLCRGCNLAIGSMGDDAERPEAAAEYVRLWAPFTKPGTVRQLVGSAKRDKRR
ncbi:endonuclease domain-containing protein [Embleya sp. NPDC050493]|uniref:endonuclease domain-containing protein n=1 Tax=Embleya sp. NPDC050493 TaxID=3363989 RepID=UPI0037AD47E2